MGRIGIGPDAGDEWIGLDRDIIMAQRGSFRAEDGGYYRATSSSETTCSCPHHKSLKAFKEKPLTKKQKAAQKKAVAEWERSIRKMLSGEVKRPRPILDILTFKARPKKKSRTRKTSKRK